MNLFLGLPILNQDIEPLLHAVAPCYSGWKQHSALQWTKPENYHLTLHFFGPILPEIVSPWILDLEKYIKNVGLLSLKINKIGNFPKENSKLWAAYVVLSPPLARLYHQIEQSVQDYQFPIENKVFLPHITFCRAKRKNVLQLEPISIDYVINVQELVLYQSQPSAEGRRYLPLHRWML